MKAKEKIEVIKEINRSEEEARKYHLGEGYHGFYEVLEEPGMFWMGSPWEARTPLQKSQLKKISKEEANKYARYSNVIFIGYKSPPSDRLKDS